MKTKLSISVLFINLCMAIFLASAEVPKVDELINLHWAVEVALAPDRKTVAFVVEVANWE